MLSSVTAKAEPSSYVVTSSVISGGGASPFSATNNGLRVDGTGNLYVVVGLNGTPPTRAFLKITPSGATSYSGYFSAFDPFYPTGGFSVSSNGSVFFARTFNPLTVSRWSPGDDLYTWTNLFTVSTGGQTWTDVTTNAAGTIVYISTPGQLYGFSNWNGTTASSNAVGPSYTGGGQGVSIDKAGNICVATSTGCYYRGVNGISYSLTSVIPQANNVNYGGRAVALDRDGQAVIVNGNSVYSTSITGQATQLVTSPPSSTVSDVYGIAATPWGDICVLTTLTSSNLTIARYSAVY
jgi:hypothetical protein